MFSIMRDGDKKILLFDLDVLVFRDESLPEKIEAIYDKIMDINTEANLIYVSKTLLEMLQTRYWYIGKLGRCDVVLSEKLSAGDIIITDGYTRGKLIIINLT